MGKGLVERTNSDFKRQVQVAEDRQAKGELLLLTERQIAFMIHTFSDVDDVQGEPVA